MIAMILLLAWLVFLACMIWRLTTKVQDITHDDPYRNERDQ